MAFDVISSVPPSTDVQKLKKKKKNVSTGRLRLPNRFFLPVLLHLWAKEHQDNQKGSVTCRIPDV